MDSNKATDFQVHEDSYEFVWGIPNHANVVSNFSNLYHSTEYVQFTCKSGVTNSWQVGYTKVKEHYFTPFLKLNNPFPKTYTVYVKWNLLEKLVEDGSWFQHPHYQMDNLTEVSVPKLITNPNIEWPLGTVFKLDGNTKWWKVEIDMIVTDGVQSVDKFRTAAKEKFQTNFANLLNNPETGDLKIVCSDGVELAAHKLILSTQNPVFAGMLSADMRERNTGVLNVDDISSSTMKILLHFLYTGEMQDAWAEPDNIVEITYAAGKYQLTEFLKMLNNELGKEDHGENNLPLLSLANKLSLQIAETRLLSRVKNMVGSVNATEQLFKMLENL